MKSIITLVFILLNYNLLYATHFYLSNKGSDNHSGNSKTTPWKSIHKLRTSLDLIQTGDSIFFERGSIFSGELNLSVSNLYIGSYGTGKKPIINGSIPLTNWINYSKNIWKSYCADCELNPTGIFRNGKQLPPGRFPNEDYLTITEANSLEHTIKDSTIISVDDFWKSAEIVVRTSRWTIDKLLASTYKDKTFTYSQIPSYPIQVGFGYFIQNHLETLDRDGEWYFKPDTKEIYLYLGEGSKPTDNNIEISFYKLGLNITHTNNVTIEGLVFTKQQTSGINLKNNQNIKLFNVEIYHSGKNGLEIADCKNPVVENSTIADSNNNGVEWRNNIGGRLLCNEIVRTGLHAGMGASGNGSYMALHVHANNSSEGNTLIESNKIDSTGYTAIDFRTGNTIINGNHISNFCLIKDDGAGIYTWENKQLGNIIEGNTITNGIGNGEGTINPAKRFVSGIYIDDRSANVLIKNNKVTNCAMAGIFLHNAKKITLKDNLLEANGTTIANKERGQLYIRLDKHSNDTIHNLGHIVVGNELIASTVSTYCLYLSADEKDDLKQLGTFQNLYSGYSTNHAIAESYHTSNPCLAPEEFTLTRWHRINTQEAETSFTIIQNSKSKPIGKNLINNSNMESGINGWTIWPEIHELIHNKSNPNNPALNVMIQGANTEALLYHSGFSLVKDKLYRLSFSVSSDVPMTIEFVPLLSNKPWRALSDYICFPISTKSKTITYYFRSNTSDRSRVNFKSNHSFTIDTISLYEISEANSSEPHLPAGY